uniref:Uncharacterized protein n=1 Tax=Mus musculus TaxID=10090 RepID=Q6R5E0_MOUSE|nr:unknown [Mus musculus]AAR87813.1 unknown [Mus musculus]
MKPDPNSSGTVFLVLSVMPLCMEIKEEARGLLLCISNHNTAGAEVKTRTLNIWESLALPEAAPLNMGLLVASDTLPGIVSFL